MRIFGIYLAYPPGVDLKDQGLGRHLGAFLGAAATRQDVRFVIACPSWTRASLRDLLISIGLRTDTFELLGPERVPALLTLYEKFRGLRKRRGKGRFKRWIAQLRRLVPLRLVLLLNRVVPLRRLAALERQLLRLRPANVAPALAVVRSVPLLLVVLLVAAPFVLIWWLSRLLVRFVSRGLRRVHRGAAMQPSVVRGRAAVQELSTRPQSQNLVLRLYAMMMKGETDLVVREANMRREIVAWYSPAAFWPEFNRISAPRLACLPDVVLSEFPVAFSGLGGDRFLQNFRQVEQTIREGNRFVVYSRHVRSETLVRRYGVPRTSVTVVPHGAQRLDDIIGAPPLRDKRTGADQLSIDLLQRALKKAVDSPAADLFDAGSLEFLFYASQFRPNKNVLCLLQAYEHLLRRDYIGHKLVLTGDPETMPEIGEFIRSHELHNDVLALHGLSREELAACYRLASLSINPSLSEGGCPFTLTESLSVGTPVVMADIEVTREVITDPELQALMLFDPYSWQALARKVRWALDNADALLDQQMPLYRQLAERTWDHVVDEHIQILDRLSRSRKIIRAPW